jgi:very-short-patch-repair endonuclease
MSNFLSPAWIVLAILIAVLLLYLVFRNGKLRFASKPILTANEIEFFGRLRKALPDHALFTQVALRAIVRPGSASSSKSYLRELSFLGAKHADFVVCHPETLAVIAIIELDDRTHNPDKDAQRDAMTGAAGYPTLRFQSKARPTVTQLREAVLACAE